MDQTPPPVPERHAGWFFRNWKWVVPSGCLFLFLIACAFVAVVTMLVFGMMKQSEPYRVALVVAKENPVVIEAIGTPIREGFFLSGNTRVNGASGEASLAIPIYGPKGKATVYVEARKSAGVWEYQELVAEIAVTGKRIELNQPPVTH